MPPYRHCFRPVGIALVSLPGHGGQPASPGRLRDRSGLWLRNAAAGLCVLAAAAVSFTAQYRMVDATRHLPAIAALLRSCGIPFARICSGRQSPGGCPGKLDIIVRITISRTR